MRVILRLSLLGLQFVCASGQPTTRYRDQVEEALSRLSTDHVTLSYISQISQAQIQFQQFYLNLTDRLSQLYDISLESLR